MPIFHATVTDPLDASAEVDATIGTASSPARTLRRGLFTGRVSWGNLAVPGFTVAQGPMLSAAERSAANQNSFPVGPVTLAITFTALRDFSLVGCRIYKTPTQAGSIPVGVWNATGTLLASTTVTWTADDGGWRTITLSAPVAATSGQGYTIGFLAPDSDYAASPWVFNGQDAVAYPFWVKTLGASAHAGSSLTKPGTGETQPHNFYVDPIAEWDDDMPGYDDGFYGQFGDGGPNVTFPVGIFDADPENIVPYAETCGVNTLIGGEQGSFDALVAAVKVAGIDWWAPVVGGVMDAPVAVQLDEALAARVVGYHLVDEPDLNTPYNSPSAIQAWRNTLRAIDSTRPTLLGLSKFVIINQGFVMQPPGAPITSWNDSWRQYAAVCDVLSADMYSLAGEDSYGPTNDELNGGGPTVYGIWTYAEHIKRMNVLCDERIPVWGIIETTSEVPSRPVPADVVKAAWAQLIAGARGLILFDHRFASVAVTQDFAAMLRDSAMAAAVSALSDQLQDLAPALLARDAGIIDDVVSSNTTAGPKGGTYGVPIEATSRVADDLAYVFAQASRPGTTTATITVSSLAGQTLTVIGEARTVDVDGQGTFTDTFAADYTVHRYVSDSPPAFSVPENTDPPALTTDGTPETGETIATSAGTWTGAPAPTFSYQWQRDGSSIGGAVTASYVLQEDDEGHDVGCHVTATNSQGSDSADSDTIMPAAASPPETPYADEVMVDSPIGYWRLDDLTDSSGNDLDLTVAAGAPVDQSSLIVSEPSNGAKGLNGSSWYSHADASILKPADAITLEAWVRPTVLGAFAILSKGPHSLRMQSNGKFYVSFHEGSGGGGDLFITGNVVANLGDTYHVVGTYDGTTIKLYVNGEFDASFDFTAVINNSSTDPLKVGGQSGATGWVGTVDEAAMYDVVLSAERISAHYTAGIG